MKFSDLSDSPRGSNPGADDNFRAAQIGPRHTLPAAHYKQGFFSEDKANWAWCWSSTSSSARLQICWGCIAVFTQCRQGDLYL